MRKVGRKNYSTEFKAEAVELSKKVGNSKAAADLDVAEDTLRRWVKLSSVAPDKATEVRLAADIEAENRKLKKEIEYLRKINDVLKKSTAIFSKDLIGDSK